MLNKHFFFAFIGAFIVAAAILEISFQLTEPEETELSDLDFNWPTNPAADMTIRVNKFTPEYVALSKAWKDVDFV